MLKVIANGRVAALVSTATNTVITAKAATMAQAWDMAQKYGAKLERR